MSGFFPPDPTVGYFLYPKTVDCAVSEAFEPRHFRSTIFYRGSLNMYLHFARLVGYRKIILVGCEMNTSTTFYEDWPEAQWIFDLPGYVQPKSVRASIAYGNTYVSKGKHSMTDAILAINEFVFKPEGIELYSFSSESVLCPEVPVFGF